ncbi:TetR/AcrR family transcriptional regulator [Roseomonas sp. GCM10028921]
MEAGVIPCELPGEGVVQRDRILSAARDVFAAEGFHVATMDAVARRAGCSKKTIYKLFASKEDLFFALLDRAKGEVCSVAIDRAKEPEAALVEFMEKVAGHILDPSAIALTRMTLAEYTHSPALLEAAERRGVGTARLSLEAYLEELGREGGHEILAAEDEARLLIGAALGAFHHELLIGVVPAFPAVAVRERIRRAVRVYLRGTRRPLGVAA